ncbi:MAG: GNAT family N-acetyltransferase [Cyanobacteria bacterium P01_G01_bin.54]
MPEPVFDPAQLQIREMSIDDIAPVFHLGEQLFTRDRYPSLYHIWDEWEVTGLYNTEPEYALIAEIVGQLAGFILGTVIAKPTITYGYIIWLGVNPQVQRCGVGDRLVDKLTERMITDGVSTMLIDTDPANTAAVHFFQRKGYGTPRQHVFFSLDLTQHDYYGKLIAYERDRLDRR